MNRKQREAARVRYEERRKSRNVAQARIAEEHAKKEAALHRALSTSVAPRLDGWAPAALREVILLRAPRLLDARYSSALNRLAELPPVRPPAEWVPRGKGKDTLFRSLAAHLLAKFEVPAILWNAFHEDQASALGPLTAHVASGGSLYEYTKARFPIPLTRKMCHDVLKTSSEHKLLDAIRRAQARAAGVDARFFAAWRTTRFAQQIGSKEDEAFWYSVLEWFAKVPMLEAAEIPPLYDFIDHRRREDPQLTMKGRTGVAMLRAMREWHGNVTKARAITGRTFQRSGFSAGELFDWRREANGDSIREVWRIGEILTEKALAEEGKRMGHCVYSYAWRIEKGDTSIWSVQMEDGLGETGRWHMATVEVRNDLRRVVQARGRYNRSITSKEHRILLEWANTNNLALALGRW